MTKKNSLILDLRSKEEYNEGHISDAINYHIDDYDFNCLVSKIDTSTNLFLYCTAGGRSELAIMELNKLGFNHIYVLDRGLMAWILDGRPLVKTNETKVQVSLLDYQKLINSKKCALVFFTAKWCIPCQPMKTYLEILTKESNEVSLITIDVDLYPNLRSLMGIEGIPYIYIYSNGIERWKWAGAVDESLIRKKLAFYIGK